MKLYEINQKMLELNALMEAGELDNETFADTMESLGLDLDDKLDNIIGLTKQLKAEAKAIKEEESNLQSRRKSKEKAVESLESYVTSVMGSLDLKKWENSRHKLVMAKTPASLKIENEEIFINSLEESGMRDFVNISKTVNKSLVRDYLKNVGELQGCKLVAGEKLRVK